MNKGIPSATKMENRGYYAGDEERIKTGRGSSSPWDIIWWWLSEEAKGENAADRGRTLAKPSGRGAVDKPGWFHRLRAPTRS